MFKKIMKIAGIVVGSVAVFTGAVIGVMAAMGKFKKKKIYPNRLFFAETEQVVIFDEINQPDKWYSFVVSGENTESKYNVNMKDCYISFENNKEATKLIELYDKNKNKLEANKSGRFEVECNEPVYYKVKPQEQDFDIRNGQFGKVVISAMGEELSMVASSKDLTIWIDRKVNLLQIDDELSYATPGVEENEFAKQVLRVGTTDKLYFDYTAKPFASLHPTTKTGEFYGKKEVELYFKDAVSGEYKVVDKDNLGTLSTIVGWDEDAEQYYFVSSEVGSYDFYIATFATYQDKINYYAELATNPDVPSIRERLDHMVVTNVSIKTYDIGVKQVVMGADDITLDLRNENLITLTETIAGGTNLKLSLIGSDDKQNYSRMNSIEFIDDVESLDLVTNGKVKLVDSVNESNTLEINLNYYDLYDYVNEKLKDKIIIEDEEYDIKFVTENGKKVSILGNTLIYLANDTKEFICSDGYLLLSDEGELTLLSTGTYLGFFRDEDGYSLIEKDDENFKYTVNKVPGENGRWNVNVKEYDGETEVFLKCLVVNSKDAYKYGKIVTSTYQIDVKEIGLRYGENFSFKDIVDGNKLSFNVTSDSFDEKLFGDIVTIGDNVSYDQCVFVTDYISDNAEDYEIDVIIGKKYPTDTPKYVLVGYYDSGKFVNKVKAVKQIAGVDTKIYVMQLDTTFDETLDKYNKESTFKKHTIKDSNPITVDVLFKPTAENVTFGIDDIDIDNDTENCQLYANQEGYVLTISDEDLSFLNEAGLNVEDFKAYLNDSKVNSNTIQITNWTYNTESKTGELEFKTLNYSEDYAVISLEFNGVPIETQPIYLVSIKPKNVSYFYTETGSSELYVGEKLADYDKDVYKITLGLTAGIIQPTSYGIYDATGTLKSSSAIELNLTNRNAADPITTGFKTDVDGVLQEFNYMSTKQEIFSIVGTSIKVNRVGTAYLKVTTKSGYIGYLKVVVEPDENFKLTDIEKDEEVGATLTFLTLKTSASEYLLNSGLAYKHDSTAIDHLVKISGLTITEFGGGDAKNIIEKEKVFYYGEVAVGNEILTVSNTDVDGWKFNRNNYKYSTLQIEFVVTVPTRENSIKVTLTFDPATKINFNSEWNNQQIYAGTSILLTEEISTGTFTNYPYYKITNISGTNIKVSEVYLNGKKINDFSSIVDYNETAKTNTFKPTETGKYTIKFSNEEIREIEVVDNVVAKLLATEFNSESTSVGFINLYSFKAKDTENNDIIYGQTAGIYPFDTTNYLNSKNLDGNIAISGNAKIFTYDGTNFKTGKITNLNTASITETISLTYNDNKLVIYLENNKLDSVDVKINNIYSVAETKDKMFIEAYRAKNVYDMLSITNSSTSPATTNGLTLSNVAISGSGLEFIYNTNTFTSTSSITSVSRQEVTFTFVDSTTFVNYTYTTTVELRPYLPSKASEYHIYAGDSGNSWQWFLFDEEKMNPDRYVEITLTKDNFDDNKDNLYTYNGSSYSKVTLNSFADAVDGTTYYNKVSLESILYYNYDADIIKKITVAYPEDYNEVDKIIKFDKFDADGPFKVKDIDSQSKKVRLCFTFTYIDGETYTDIVDIIIKNELKIEAVYPYKGLAVVEKPKLSSGDSEFITWYQAEESIKFEPVLVGQTISLIENGDYKGRVSITNHGSESVELSESTLSVQVVASSDILRSYTINYNSDDKTIKFATSGALGNNQKGYLVLKITTSTGSYTYYTVQLVNKAVTVTNDKYTANAESSEIDFVSNNSLLGNTIAGESSILVNFGFGVSASKDKASFYLLNVEGIGKDEICKAEISKDLLRQNLSGKKLPALKNYVTLKIALIYHDGNSYINAGILTFYVAPYGAPGVKCHAPECEEEHDHELDSDLSDFADEMSGYPNGYYTATILYSATEVDNPFDDNPFKLDTVSGYTEMAAFLTDDKTTNLTDNIGFAEIDGTSIKITKYVSETTTFVVKYYFQHDTDTTKNSDKFIRYVTYTLNGFTTNAITGDMNVTMGELNADGTDFVTTKKLSELVGDDYKRTINIVFDDGTKIEGINLKVSNISDLDGYDFNTSKVSKTINGKTISLYYNDGYYLEFTQGVQQYNIEFTIEYNDICNPNTNNTAQTFERLVKVTVKNNIVMSVASGSDGESASNPLLTTLQDSGIYNTTYPNYITIKKEGSSLVKYTVVGSGFELIAPSTTKLEISFNDYDFVKGITSSKLIDDSDYEADGEYKIYKIYFTHVGVNQPLTMTIKFKNGGNYYLENDGVNQASAELHLSIQKTYEGLESNYIVNGANHEVIDSWTTDNKHTINLTGFFGKISDEDVKESTDPDVNILNKYRFTLKVPENVPGESKSQLGSLELNSVLENIGFFDSNNPSNPNKLTFNNGEGYALTFNNDEGYALTFNKPSGQKWVDFTFGNPYFGITYSFNLMENENGLIQDLYTFNDKPVTFEDDYASIIVKDNHETPNDVETYLVGGTKEYKNLATIVDEHSSKYYISAISIDGETGGTINKYEITGGKEYIHSHNDYTFSIQIKNGQLGIKLLAGAGTGAGRTKFETLVYAFTLYSDSKVVENFKIVFANYDIAFMENDIIQDDSIIELDDKINIINNVTTTDTNLNYAEMIVDGSYYIDVENGKTYNDINQLVTYDDSNNALTLKVIASKVQATIKFEVFTEKDDGYSLGQYEYTFTALRNFYFKVNGNLVKDKDFAETDYLLLDDHITDDGANKVYQDNYTTPTYSSVDYTIHEEITYDTDLRLQIAKLNDQTKEIIVGNTEMEGYISVASSNEDVIKFDKSKDSIIFYKDYYNENESLVLTISVDLIDFGRGFYEFKWYINPVGFINMVPKEETVETNNDQGFISGQPVDLLSNNTSESQGIDFFHTHGIQENSITIGNLAVNYSISTDDTKGFDSSNSYTVAEFYGSDGSEYADVNSDLLTNSWARVKLPYVKQSSSDIPSSTHYVTYKVYINYQVGGKTYEQTKYVTYGVRNPQSIKDNANGSQQIDVDKNSFTYNSTDKTLTIFFNSSEYTGIDIVPLFNLTESEYMTWSNLDSMYVRFKMDKTTSDKTGTVFSATDKKGNEYEYVYYKLIKETVTDNKGTDITSDDTTHNKYLINISEPYKDITKVENFIDSNKLTLDNNTLFKNFMNADIDIMANGEVVHGIKAYNGQTGFKLYTSNSIKSYAEAINEDDNEDNDLDIYTFSDIFKKTSYFNADAYKIKDEMVLALDSRTITIGTTEGETDWINGDVTTGKYTSAGTITIPLIDRDPTTFNIYSVEYTRTGSDLYSISRTFYVINKNRIIAPNLTLDSGVTFPQLSVEDYTFSQDNFKEYKMDSTSKYLVAGTASGVIEISTTYKIGDASYTAHEVETKTFNNAVSINKNTGEIYVSKAFLQAYKNMNQSKTSVTLLFNTTADPNIEFAIADPNIEFAIEFKLPSVGTLNLVDYELINLTESNFDTYKENLYIIDSGKYTKVSLADSSDIEAETDYFTPKQMTEYASGGVNTITRQISISSNVENNKTDDILSMLEVSSYTIITDDNKIDISNVLTNYNIQNIQVLTNSNFVNIVKYYQIKITDQNFDLYKNNLYIYDSAYEIYTMLDDISLDDIDDSITYYTTIETVDAIAIKFDKLNILVGQNSADGLIGKNTIYNYLYTTEQHNISIEIQITYDIDGNTSSTSDTITTKLILEFKKA